ncbi:hypothetical protein LCGC14_2502570 [marine sediment metagenome]|uniref:Uncharacterized protein n=1 Tax=marine sediment metagenome TaxID=412755 RepID=A0A0F9BPE9_9ZZZZ
MFNRKEYSRKYYLKNQEEIIKKNCKRFVESRKNNILVKLACNIRKRVNSAVKGKMKPTLINKSLGCGLNELRSIWSRSFISIEKLVK